MARTYPIRSRSSRKRTVCGCFCRIGSRVDGTPMNGLIFSRRRGGIVKVQEIAADLGVDGVKQRIRGQRA